LRDATLRGRIAAVLSGDARLSRRDLARVAAKVGVAGAGVAWVAPRFETVAYAASSAGSPQPTTTSGSVPVSIQGGPTCFVSPQSVAGDPPYSVRVNGSGWAPSSRIVMTLVGVRVVATITTRPDGSYNLIVGIDGPIAPGRYQIEFAGFDPNGNADRCFHAFAVTAPTATTQSVPATATTGGGGGPKPPANGGGGGGEQFSGADTRTLLLLGTGAVVVGRMLYSLRNRMIAAADAADAGSD
jgi:hypothetical protein